VNETLILLGREAHSFCRVWQQNTGVAYREDELTGRKQFIAYGVRGGADISGILFDGTRIELEAKTGHAVQSIQQKRFEAMITSMRGIYYVFRSPEDAFYYLRERYRERYAQNH
jgi:hypothetical protein